MAAAVAAAPPPLPPIDTEQHSQQQKLLQDQQKQLERLLLDQKDFFLQHCRTLQSTAAAACKTAAAEPAEQFKLSTGVLEQALSACTGQLRAEQTRSEQLHTQLKTVQQQQKEQLELFQQQGEQQSQLLQQLQEMKRTQTERQQQQQQQQQQQPAVDLEAFRDVVQSSLAQSLATSLSQANFDLLQAVCSVDDTSLRSAQLMEECHATILHVADVVTQHDQLLHKCTSDSSSALQALKSLAEAVQLAEQRNRQQIAQLHKPQSGSSQLSAANFSERTLIDLGAKMQEVLPLNSHLASSRLFTIHFFLSVLAFCCSPFSICCV